MWCETQKWYEDFFKRKYKHKKEQKRKVKRLAKLEMQQKMDSVLAYKSQFYDPNSKEVETYISSPHFLEALKARMIQWAQIIGTEYAEGFTTPRYIATDDLMKLI